MPTWVCTLSSPTIRSRVWVLIKLRIYPLQLSWEAAYRHQIACAKILSTFYYSKSVQSVQYFIDVSCGGPGIYYEQEGKELIPKLT